MALLTESKKSRMLRVRIERETYQRVAALADQQPRRFSTALRQVIALGLAEAERQQQASTPRGRDINP